MMKSIVSKQETHLPSLVRPVAPERVHHFLQPPTLREEREVARGWPRMMPPSLPLPPPSPSPSSRSPPPLVVRPQRRTNHYHKYPLRLLHRCHCVWTKRSTASQRSFAIAFFERWWWFSEEGVGTTSRAHRPSSCRWMVDVPRTTMMRKSDAMHPARLPALRRRGLPLTPGPSVSNVKGCTAACSVPLSSPPAGAAPNLSLLAAAASASPSLASCERRLALLPSAVFHNLRRPRRTLRSFS